MKNEIQTSEKQSFGAYMRQDAVKNYVNNMLNNSKESTKFIASIVTAVNNNAQLAECAKSTILSAALLGHSLNLSPSASLGQYFIVPFDDRRKGCKVAQFQLGYKGFIQLAIRSGQYKNINVISVKEGELIAYKTLLRQLISKWGIMSIEMEKGYVGDQAVINADGSSDYVDNATRYPQIVEKEEDKPQEEETEEELPKVEGEIVEDKKS